MKRLTTSGGLKSAMQLDVEVKSGVVVVFRQAAVKVWLLHEQQQGRGSISAAGAPTAGGGCYVLVKLEGKGCGHLWCQQGNALGGRMQGVILDKDEVCLQECLIVHPPAFKATTSV